MARNRHRGWVETFEPDQLVAALPDLPAILQLLEPPDGLGLGVDVDVGVPDPVGGEELLDPLAVGAPRGPVYGHDRLVRRGHRPTTSTQIPGRPRSGGWEHASATEALASCSASRSGSWAGAPG